MSGGTRAPGWYPDPWGTDEERYFDGDAWARSTRRPGDLGAPVPTSTAPGSDAPTGGNPIGIAPISDPPGTISTPNVPPPAPAPEVTPPTVPAGWYADPWGAAEYRYWDGREWTGHVSGPSSSEMTGEPRIEEERVAGRWAKLGLAWGGPALAVTTITGAFQWHWLAEHWDEVTKPGSNVQPSSNGGAQIAGQLATLVLIVVAVLFLLWFHRAASNAISAGMRARRKPVLATLSFIIPILNLWWPYQSACDMLPADHPGRVAVRRWWALWIACTFAGLAVAGAAMTLNDIALAVTTAVGVVLAVLAAFAARAVVDEISNAHGQLMARPA